VRRAAVALSKVATRKGITLPEVAGRLGVSSRTLLRWKRAWRVDRLGMKAIGRPSVRACEATRRELGEVFERLGPATGVPYLQKLFPQVSRRELFAIAFGYRMEHQTRAGVVTQVLHWTRPGSVWAMDFSQAPRPIAGRYPYLLSVRDLASGRQLLALPAEDQSAEVARAALVALFKEHGPPLVLKSDNGSGFIASELRNLLAENRVLLLLSPVRCPQYNGACEAGIGGLKTRAHHEAARNGRAGDWSCDDVESARLLGNSSPPLPGWPSPDERWEAREPVSQHEREALYAHLGALRKLDPQLSDRIAIRCALVARGYLSIERRPIPLPINPAFRVNVS